MIIGGIISLVTLGLFLYTLYLGDTTTSRVIFVFAIVLMGIASNIWSLARQAYIAETTPVAWRSRGLSTLGGMMRLGTLIGPLAATGLLAIWYMTSVFYFNVLMTAIAVVLVIFFVAPDPHIDIESIPENERARYEADLAKPQSAKATAIMGIAINALTLLRSSRNVIVPLWGTYLGFDPAFVTAVFGVTALLDAGFFFFAGAVTDKWGRHWGLFPTLFLMSFGVVVMVLWQTPVGFVVGAAIIGIGNGFGAGINMTIGADLSPATNKAAFLGKWQAIVTVGSAAGPFVISGITAAAGLQWALLAIAGIGFAGLIWAMLLLSKAYALIGLDVKGNPLS